MSAALHRAYPTMQQALKRSAYIASNRVSNAPTVIKLSIELIKRGQAGAEGGRAGPGRAGPGCKAAD